MRAVLLRGGGGPPHRLPSLPRTGPRPPTGGSGLWPLAVRVLRRVFGYVLFSLCSRLDCSALALLVPGVRADHHDAAVAADDPALAADLLDARLDLHG